MSRNKSLTQQTFSGFIWKFAERISAQLVSMVVSIVLARLLMPKDYGVVSLTTIFITICNVFVTSGFGTALVQKKDADEVDFSSVFYAGIVLSILLYIILFFCAPLVAKFYKNDLLTAVLRVMGLRLPIAAINSVQQAYVSRRMAFRKFFWATFFGTIVSAVVGIWMAYAGYGVWALVAQYLTNVCIDTIVLAIVDRWYPRLKFSLKRLKRLLSYGWKLLVSGLLDTGYNELRGLVIGKKYSASDLAFYSKGQSFPSIISVNVDNALQSALFSAMTKRQDNIAKLKDMMRKSIRVGSYVILPCMVGMAVIGEVLIKVLLTDKWLPAAPYISIASIVFAIHPIQSASYHATNALGRSDVHLKLDIVSKVIGIVSLAISLWFGVFWIALSGLIANILSAIINAFPNKKLFGYGYLEQIKDILPALLLSLFMGGIVYCISFIPLPDIVILLLQIVVGIAVYVIASIVLRIESFYFIINTIKSFFRKDKDKAGDAVAENSDTTVACLDGSVCTDGSDPTADLSNKTTTDGEHLETENRVAMDGNEFKEGP